MKILKILLIAFIGTLFLSNPADAQQSSQTVNQERLDDVMTNVGNQFVYAFFGKDLLILYLNDEQDIEAVRTATDAELATLTAPFNPLTGKFLLGALSVIYALSVGYFILRLSMFLLEQVWLYQRHEEAPLTDKETRGILVKMVLLGGLVVVPLPLSNEITDDEYFTSLAIGGLFSFLGKSHEIADDSMKELVESQRQTLKTVVLPAADAKQFEMMSVNEFFTCLSLQSSSASYAGNSVSMDVYKKDDESAEGVFSRGDCSLTVSLGIDTQSDEKIKKLLAQDPSLPLTPDLFSKAQKQMFQNVLEEIFVSARRNAKWLSMPRESTDFHKGTELMRPYTGEVLTVSELRDWADMCDSISNLNWSSHDSISGYDRSIFHIWSSRCMSKEVTSKMLYPDSYSALDKLLNEGSSQQPSIGLCVDQASLAQVLSDSRFSAQYTSGGQGVVPDAVETVSLRTCLSSICSSSSVVRGGMYACANAVDLYESSLRDQKLIDRGTMTLGFYMFNLFVHQPPSSMAKEVFNRFSFSFSNTSKPEPEVEGKYFSASFMMPESSPNHYEWNSIIRELQNSMARDDMPAVTPVKEMTNLPGWVGYSRLLTCAQSPLQVSNGYVCNNLPQEFSRFGFSLLQNVITVKTLMTIGNTTNLLRIPKSPGGMIDAVGESSNASKAVLLSAAMAFTATQTGVADTIYEKLGNLGLAGTDQFGHLDRAQLASWAENPLLIGIVALGKASSESGVIKFIEYVLLITLLVGVLFAFLMPLFPMIMVLSALSKFAYLLIKVIMFTGFRLTDAIFENDPDFIGEQLDRLWADWLSVLLKLPLLVVGIMLAWLMSNVVVGHVITSINLTVPTNDGIQGILDLFVILIVTGVIIFIIYNMVLTVIESFYDFTVEWILGTLTNSPFAERKAAGWKDSKDILHFIGR
jgi:hypothetical protein